ncbi:bifunctional helix-turn-helix transcriptional regulator/GNAT family N-acetyltransferase [Streptomyces sp. B1866]|uniref:bifunctional helix-turn-helix transcriptional regulator/GNAT family N-acetyltransferase n=1 Tax=Streptomyces sp. B1866 TaxID=3075431 RepID=UPI00288D4077|nr:bifunctional helix-turn-helix transcriptional regulator/GNAT family N-acetyltransferase [Streptomyces sp. B1866]MDT3399329.1 bifunctional helix-turn-helix transcriptional regulator/GNAT family N-acetyltransferase [Streptomyces sp. B1866]
MGVREDLDAAVGEVRAFNRLYTRVIGALDYPDRLSTPYTLSEARILYELAQRERTHVSRLREDLGLTAAHVSRTLTRFEERGLITRERHRRDARFAQVLLTAEGRAAAADVDARSRESVAATLRALARTDLRRLREALRTAHEVFSGRRGRDDADGGGDFDGVRLREPHPGDLGWIVQRHGALYAREYGWNAEFEALVARIVADFGAGHDPARERAWIAEMGGRAVGSVLCVRDEAPGAARLRLLLVEPEARGAGLGERLVRACADFARTAGYGELVLWTNDVLTAARAIYERVGFELVAERPHRSYGADLVGQDWRMDLT